MNDERVRSVSTSTAALLILGMLTMLMSSPIMLLAMMRRLLGRKQSSATPLGELVPRWQNFNFKYFFFLIGEILDRSEGAASH